jgi:hypothetical protein
LSKTMVRNKVDCPNLKKTWLNPLDPASIVDDDASLFASCLQRANQKQSNTPHLNVMHAQAASRLKHRQ